MIENGVPAASYPNTEIIDTIEESIIEVLGKEGLQSPLYNPGADDFHLMARDLGCKAGYFAIGAGATPGLHHQDMVFDLSALEYGSKILLNAINKRFRVNSQPKEGFEHE